jgi:thiamine phosphate synthase YjbQ (UPF0047 family)
MSTTDVNYWETKLLPQNLVNVLEKIIPTYRIEGQYLHPGPKHIECAKTMDELPSWSLNTDAHLHFVIMGQSESLPIIDGGLELEEIRRIYFADFDRVRVWERTAMFQVIGE